MIGGIFIPIFNELHWCKDGNVPGETLVQCGRVRYDGNKDV